MKLRMCSTGQKHHLSWIKIFFDDNFRTKTTFHYMEWPKIWQRHAYILVNPCMCTVMAKVETPFTISNILFFYDLDSTRDLRRILRVESAYKKKVQFYNFGKSAKFWSDWLKFDTTTLGTTETFSNKCPAGENFETWGHKTMFSLRKTAFVMLQITKIRLRRAEKFTYRLQKRLFFCTHMRRILRLDA